MASCKSCKYRYLSVTQVCLCPRQRAFGLSGRPVPPTGGSAPSHQSTRKQDSLATRLAGWCPFLWHPFQFSGTRFCGTFPAFQIFFRRYYLVIDSHLSESCRFGLVGRLGGWLLGWTVGCGTWCVFTLRIPSRRRINVAPLDLLAWHLCII
jgi:hypothetical protein